MALTFIDGSQISGTLSNVANTTLRGSGTNLFQQSSALTNVYWNTSLITTTGSQTDPFGGSTGLLINDGTSNGLHYLTSGNFTVTATSYTYSIYAKAGTANYFGIYSSLVNQGAFFNLTTGAFTANILNAPASYTSSNTGLASGWWRLSITVSSTAGTEAIRFFVSEDGTNYSFTGTSKTVTISSPQAEIGSVTNAYVPTTTTSVYGTPTLSFSGASSIGLQQDGSLYLQPAGIGALQGQATTSSTVGGNARGQNAVDWQTSRGSASQVASGYATATLSGLSNLNNGFASAIVGGNSNQISSAYSIVGAGRYNQSPGGFSGVFTGQSNFSTGIYSFIGGGAFNYTNQNSAITTQSANTYSNTSVILSGTNAAIKVGQFVAGTGIQGDPPTYVATISGTSLTLSQAATATGTATLSFYTAHSVVVGGGNNTANGSYSFVGAGGDAGNYNNGNRAVGDWSAIVGGQNQYASGKYTFIGSGNNNSVTGDYNVVGGGYQQSAGGGYTFIGGGYNNVTGGNYSTVSGGVGNQANAFAATVGGGWNNYATGNEAFVGGGNNNTAGGIFNFIGGGYNNVGNQNAPVTTQAATTYSNTYVLLSGTNASIKVGQYINGTGMVFPTYVSAISGTTLTLSQASNASGSTTLTFYTPQSVVVGGGYNTANGAYSFVGGGGDAGNYNNGNRATGDWSTIVGGTNNYAAPAAPYAFIGGGQSNVVANYWGTVVGGTNVQNYGFASTSVGGYNNFLGYYNYAFLGGGQGNQVSAHYSTLVAGSNNFIQTSGTYGFLGGGANNVVNGAYATLAGGQNNYATGQNSTVGGGQNNTSSGSYGVVAGGTNNIANGFDDFIGAGQTNLAQGNFSFIGNGFYSQAANYSAIVTGMNHITNGYFGFIGGGYKGTTTSGTAVTSQTANTYSNTYVVLSGTNAAIKVGQMIFGTGIDVPNCYVAVINGNILTLSSNAQSSANGITLSFYTPYGTVVNGGNNTANGAYSFVGGGGDAGSVALSNKATGDWSFVGGGRNNTASGAGSAVVGGGYYTNTSGGWPNVASGDGSFIGGGGGNSAAAFGTVVLGGFVNNSLAIYAAIAGGYSHNASGQYSFIGGGSNNSITSAGTNGFLGGGANNVISGTLASVVGGTNNYATNSYGFVGGGNYNRNSAYGGFIGGGESNLAGGYDSGVAFGASNQTTGGYSFVGGGLNNLASGGNSVMVGGYFNTASGYNTFIGGGERNSGASSSAVTTQSATTYSNTSVILSGSNASIKVGQLIIGTGINSYPIQTYVAAISGTTLTLSQNASASGSTTLSFFTPNSVVVGGGYNTANGSYSFVGGGGDAGNYNNGNVASGDWSVVVGGKNNIASGIASFVGGGGTNGPSSFNNIASGTWSVAVGGLNSLATGVGSFVGGGYVNIASGQYSSIVSGARGITRAINGNFVFSPVVPIADASGVSQSALLILGRQTTDATPTVLASDSSSASTTNQVILPNNSAYTFKGTLIAGVTGAGNTSSWEFRGCIKRGANAASTALVGVPKIDNIGYDSGAASWTFTLTADTTNGGLALTVTGQASTTIRWVAKIETTEMTY